MSPVVETREPHPRRWWTGPLDVERLAWTAVGAVRDAARAVAAARGLDVEIDTSPELVAASFAAMEHLRVEGRAPVGFAPMSGFFRASDGWVRLHANYPHHAAALTRALGVTDRPGLERALSLRSAEEVEGAVGEAGGIAVAVRSSQEWAQHPHAVATSGDPWAVRAEAGGREPLGGAAEVLAGVRVLDLTRVIAGPTCSQLLACLGAEVLRIDPPGRPELLDQFLSNGMGKRSAGVDLSSAGLLIEELLAGADVVLLGYRPGSLARFGLDPDDLLARHPRLVVGSLSAWGEQGPWGRRPGFDSIVQAATGIGVLCGDPRDPDGRPGALPVQALDHATGHLMAAEVMAMLAAGRAGVVRVSLLGAARTLLGYAAPPREPPAPLAVPQVELDSPHGHLRGVPAPLTVDGQPLARPVGRYGDADPRWARREGARHKVP